MRPDNSFLLTKFTDAGFRNIKYFPTSTPTPPAIAIEQIKLETEGWEQDHSVPEPVEPSSKKS